MIYYPKESQLVTKLNAGFQLSVMKCSLYNTQGIIVEPKSIQFSVGTQNQVAKTLVEDNEVEELIQFLTDYIKSKKEVTNDPTITNPEN